MCGTEMDRAVEALRRGSLVIVPTDTVYGIAADPRVAGAEERIYAAKERDRGKPIPLLAAGIAAVEAYGALLSDVERELARRFWPGPLTLVLRIGGRVGPSNEGFRVPDHAVTLELLRRVGGVLRVTSANRSGDSPALTADEARQALGGYAEVVLDAGRAPGGRPSTVARVEARDGTSAEPEVIVLRDGAIPGEELAAAARMRGGECRAV